MTFIIIFLLLILGAALGSFFNVLIYRLPLGQSIITPPSHCGECKRHIPIYLNIPIVSYLMLGGKCRYCGAKIHWHHLLVEIITPLILIGIFLQYGLFTIVFVKYAVLAMWMIPIFFIDAFHQIIPHKLSIPLIPLGIIFALFPNSDVGIYSSLIAAGVMFGFLLLIAWLYRISRKMEGLGGGDIWLFTGVASFVGLFNLPFLVILASLLGIIYFLIFIRDKDQVFAFGTFISVSVVLWSLLEGEKLINNLFYGGL